MIKRSSIIVSFILVTCLVAGGVELFCRSLGQALVVDVPASVETQKNSGTTAPDQSFAAQVEKSTRTGQNENYSIITKRSLFGKTEQKETKTEPPPEESLETTTLDLVLLGTISGDANTQRAFIKQQKNNSQDIYYKGDAIGSAIIKEVQRGKVILTVNGKDEILLMEELKSSQVPDRVTPPRRKNIVRPPQPSEPTTRTAAPLRKMTFKADNTQETHQ